MTIESRRSIWIAAGVLALVFLAARTGWFPVGGE